MTVNTNPPSTQKIKSSWTNNLEAATYVAPVGLMFFDTYTGFLRLGDGVTPGGIPIGGGGGGNPAGPNGSIQFNNNGQFGGNSNLTYSNGIFTSNAISFTNSLYVGNTLFTRTLTVGRSSSPVTVPLASNNSFNVLSATGAEITVYTT